MSADLTLDDGRFDFLTVLVRFHCTPAVDDLFAFYDGVGTDAADGVLRLRRHGIATKLSGRRHGVSDLTVDGRFSARRFTGTVSARLTLAHATCTSKPIRLDLVPAA